MPEPSSAGAAPGPRTLELTPNLVEALRPASLAELENEGAPLVLASEQEGQLRSYRFLYGCADDLTLKDVSQLLALYKGLVIKHEALCRAVEHRRTNWKPPGGET